MANWLMGHFTSNPSTLHKPTTIVASAPRSATLREGGEMIGPSHILFLVTGTMLVFSASEPRNFTGVTFFAALALWCAYLEWK